MFQCPTIWLLNRGNSLMINESRKVSQKNKTRIGCRKEIRNFDKKTNFYVFTDIPDGLKTFREKAVTVINLYSELRSSE